MDAHGAVLYVGKAKSLRQRLTSYFADPASLPANRAAWCKAELWRRAGRA